MAFDPSNLAAASFMPGLQNSGTFQTQVLINGTLNASGSASGLQTSSMDGSFIVPLEDPTVITVLRVNLPNADGDLASKWFPLIGTVILDNSVSASVNWRLVLYASNAPTGRKISYNFVNLVQFAVAFTDFPINIYGHLYTIPW